MTITNGLHQLQHPFLLYRRRLDSSDLSPCACHTAALAFELTGIIYHTVYTYCTYLAFTRCTYRICARHTLEFDYHHHLAVSISQRLIGILFLFLYFLPATKFQSHTPVPTERATVLSIFAQEGAIPSLSIYRIFQYPHCLLSSFVQRVHTYLFWTFIAQRFPSFWRKQRAQTTQVAQNSFSNLTFFCPRFSLQYWRWQWAAFQIVQLLGGTALEKWAYTFLTDHSIAREMDCSITYLYIGVSEIQEDGNFAPPTQFECLQSLFHHHFTSSTSVFSSVRLVDLMIITTNNEKYPSEYTCMSCHDLFQQLRIETKVLVHDFA